MRRVLVLLFAFAFGIVANASAYPITIDTLIPDPENGASGGGFWLGTEDLSARGLGIITMSVGQTFTAYRDFVGASGLIDLRRFSSIPYDDQSIHVNLALAPDAGGVPGAAIAEDRVELTNSTDLIHRYSFDFGGVPLSDGQRYWILATSTNQLLSTNDATIGILPVWVISDRYTGSGRYTGDMAWRINQDPWTFQDQSLSFNLEGTLIGDPIANGDGPPESTAPPRTVPEPSTLLLFAMGALMFSRRRAA